MVGDYLLVRINFIFIIHFHQPTGQLDWITERIYNNCYKLLLNIFKSFPDIKISVHISGPLLLNMVENYREWIDEIAKLGDYGTIEFLAGSIGEAILPILPQEDRFYQVKEYIRVFEKYFGYKPRGLWLPERVWEPNIVEPLARNGIEYVVVDDSTLYRSGRGGDDALYAWVTEDSGYKLKLLFIDTSLRYILPWRSHEEVFNYMLSRGDPSGSRYLLWGSDAEKFGEWKEPEWARWWLTEFFHHLRMRGHEVATIHPSEYIEKYGVRGLLYPQPGSYDKMLEWSGGYFRNFLVKYRESNNLHKKMLWVRRKLVEASVPPDTWRLYHLAQCNDAYWHGLFGGIYLTPLRQALYEYFIRAERIAEETMDYYRDSKMVIHRIDFDYDGDMEVLVETPLLNAYFKPGDGGSLFELDYKEEGYEHNLQDTMTRYYEPYLEGIGFRPDWHRRVSLREHIWSPHTSLHDWVNNTPFTDWSDLALGRYSSRVEDDGTIVMRRIAHYYPPGHRPIELFIEKRVHVDQVKPILKVEYRVENQGDGTIYGKLGFEYILSPKLSRWKRKSGFTGYCVNGVDKAISGLWVGETSEVVVKSPVFYDVVLSTSSSTEYWVSPLNMPARTEKGILQNFEGLGVMPVYSLELKPGEEFKQVITLYIKR